MADDQITVILCSKCHKPIFDPNQRVSHDNLPTLAATRCHAFHPFCLSQMRGESMASDENGNFVLCPELNCNRAIRPLDANFISPATDQIAAAPIARPDPQIELDAARQRISRYEYIMENYRESVQDRDATIRRLQNQLQHQREVNRQLRNENATLVNRNQATRPPRVNVASRNMPNRNAAVTSTTDQRRVSTTSTTSTNTDTTPANTATNATTSTTNATNVTSPTPGTSSGNVATVRPFDNATSHRRPTNSHAAAALSNYEYDTPMRDLPQYNADGSIATMGFRPLRSGPAPSNDRYEAIPPTARNPTSKFITEPAKPAEKQRPHCMANLSKSHNRFYKKFKIDSKMLKPFYPLNALPHEFTTLGVFVGENDARSAVAAQDVLLAGDGFVLGVAEWIMYQRDIREYMHPGLYGREIRIREFISTLASFKRLPPRLIISIGNLDAFDNFDSEEFKELFRRLIKICRDRGVREIYAVPIIQHAEQDETVYASVMSVFEVNYSTMLGGRYALIDPYPWFVNYTPTVGERPPMYTIQEHEEFAVWIRHTFIPPTNDASEAIRQRYREPENLLRNPTAESQSENESSSTTDNRQLTHGPASTSRDAQPHQAVNDLTEDDAQPGPSTKAAHTESWVNLTAGQDSENRTNDDVSTAEEKIDESEGFSGVRANEQEARPPTPQPDNNDDADNDSVDSKLHIDEDMKSLSTTVSELSDDENQQAENTGKT
ncbi:unnamed protein product, partial [Allacma fusca]